LGQKKAFLLFSNRDKYFLTNVTILFILFRFLDWAKWT